MLTDVKTEQSSVKLIQTSVSVGKSFIRIQEMSKLRTNREKVTFSYVLI